MADIRSAEDVAREIVREKHVPARCRCDDYEPFRSDACLRREAQVTRSVANIIRARDAEVRARVLAEVNARTLADDMPACAARCRSCIPDYPLMRVCDECGSKRCPRTKDHRYACVGELDPQSRATALKAWGVTAREVVDQINAGAAGVGVSLDDLKEPEK